MKALTCEMCGSTDILKQDGVYVCQACGTKYTVEEAKKMMVEGTVEVKGTVTIDTSAEVTNLFELARRAVDLGSFNEAYDYYRQIVLKDPNNWEANTYLVSSRYNAEDATKLTESAPLIIKSLRAALALVKQHAPQDDIQSIILNISRTILRASENKATALDDCLRNPPKGLTLGNNNQYFRQIVDAMNANASIAFAFGDEVEALIGQEDACVDLWKQGIKASTRSNEKRKGYIEKIKKYDSNYKPHNSGCYVATAVYGSYDCPEVWTLRRYRDNVLARQPLGRLFIKTYYAISPTFVKLFCHNLFINRSVRYKLDRFVSKLHAQGIGSGPYVDFN